MVSVARWLGSPQALIISLLALASGLTWRYSEDWWIWYDRAVYQITLWIALIIQGSQERDTKALHLKLDELIRVTEARNRFVDLEDASQKEIESLTEQFKALRERPDG